MPTLEITAADPAEMPALIDVSERTMRACYAPFLGREAVEGWIAAGEVESFFEAALPRCFLLRFDGAIVGFSAVDGALLELLMIDVDWQHQGLGARLLAHTEAALFREHPQIRLESFAANTTANAFYRAMGWRQGDGFVDPETGIDMLHFTKRRD